MALSAADRELACCHGYLVAAGGGPVGFVETPLFGAAHVPDYLIVRTTESIDGVFRFVPTALVDRLDPETKTVTLRVRDDAVAALPDRLPLARRRV